MSLKETFRKIVRKLNGEEAREARLKQLKEDGTWDQMSTMEQLAAMGYRFHMFAESAEARRYPKGPEFAKILEQRMARKRNRKPR